MVQIDDASSHSALGVGAQLGADLIDNRQK